MFLVTSTRRANNASPCCPAGTNNRRAQVQRWPEVIKADCTMSWTAASVSATPLTMSGLFPPISRARILPGCPANCSCSIFPVRELPVKNNPSMSLWEAKALPVSTSPWTKFKTPAGRLAAAHNLTISCATIGVRSLGLNTTVLPAINAGTMWPFGRCPGKL